jgi:hypothetical protein
MVTARYTIACLLCLLFALPARSEEADPRGILRKRTARWYHELKHLQDDKSDGAESNPTGSPIAGGKGYRDIVTSGTVTVKTLDRLRSALDRARSGDVVFLPGDLEIDLSGKPALAIPGGVTLASDRGRGDSKGARLYSRNLDTAAMIESGGAYGRVTGLRLEGPHKGRKRVPLHSRGVRIGHFAFEVDNCEI